MMFLTWQLAPLITSVINLATFTLPSKAGGKEHILRTSKKYRFWPTQVFSLIRFLDPVACWWLFQNANDETEIENGLTGKEWIFTAMAAVAAIRQSVWIVWLNQTEIEFGFAIQVGLFNNWCNWTYAQCLLKRRDDSSMQDEMDSHTAICVLIFIAGSFLETASEIQRHLFKSRSENKGRLYIGGLFQYARHINYFGYILWRIALGLISGPPYTLAFAMFHAFDFYYRAIPLMTTYMKQRYGEQWEDYKQKTKHVLVPGFI